MITPTNWVVPVTDDSAELAEIGIIPTPTDNEEQLPILDPNDPAQLHEEQREAYQLDSVPDLLKGIVAVHQEPQEQLLALMATTVIASSLIPKVSFNYGQHRNYPQLMLFVVAPPASGKGTIALTDKLVLPITRHLTNDYKERLDQYNRQLAASKKKGYIGPIPIKPKFPQLRVSGNITNAKLIQQLADNGHLPVLMIETEADVLASALVAEHGQGMSATLRQAGHNETVSFSRRGNDEVIMVEKPKLAVVLAGTPSQVPKIFNGNSDGLFSRFLFLHGDSNISWRSGRPCPTCPQLDNHYEHWAGILYSAWKWAQHHEAEVHFSSHQWDQLDNCWRSQQTKAWLNHGENAVSIVRRYSLMTLRLATVFTFLRQVDPYTGALLTSDSTWQCTQADFELALSLTQRSFQDSLEQFVTMSRNGSHTHSRSTTTRESPHMTFLRALPDKFLKKEALPYSTSPRTTTRWLESLCALGLLERTANGQYQKTPEAHLHLTVKPTSN